MSRWLIRVGAAILILGLVLASPVVDFLPVDVFHWLDNLLHPGPSNRYFRVVPANGDSASVTDALILAGLFVLASGLAMKRFDR